MCLSRGFGVGRLLLLVLATGSVAQAQPGRQSAVWLDKIGINKGICVVVGFTDPVDLIQLADESALLIYAQSDNPALVKQLRNSAAERGLLGERIYAEHSADSAVHLASNLADAAVLLGAEVGKRQLQEALRVTRPGAHIVAASKTIVKPAIEGTDDWSHPYHGPDNNPQSSDALAKAPFLTQFLASPWYVPMPQVTVVSGGRMFKAFGHIALKEREWPWLNNLVAINAYNGTELWKRDLLPGAMIHRSTMIATPETLYLAEGNACKMLDAATGEVDFEVTVPQSVDADGNWKWLALKGDTLFALIGPTEPPDKVIRGGRVQPGWPWSGLGEGYAGDYRWGFGHTLVAFDANNHQLKWEYRSDTPIDSRALCLAAGRLFIYSHANYLAALDASSGAELWKTTDSKLLAAIGQHDKAETASKGFASTAYAKANAHGVYFAGPQRTRLVAVSATDGSLMWDYGHGNFQLVLRDDALYAMGRHETSKMFDYRTGEIIADLECYRGNCTRATGSVDSIFTRGYRHTGTMRLDLTGNYPRRLPLMRPACQDGVVIANGLLYWGPWMCDCNHSLVGMISLAPVGDFDFANSAKSDRLEVSNTGGTSEKVQNSEFDWPSYRGGPSRFGSSPVAIADRVGLQWSYQTESTAEPTAPVAVGDVVFWSGTNGLVQAADADTGETRWRAFTGGAVRFPPEVVDGRVFVGSGDGHVYCFEATTGEQLWRFQAAPIERRIPVHGRLLSNWPVGSGVLVHEESVYAAAGITSYDGTHVYALDAMTGNLRWQNNSSGRLVEDRQVTGVSVQGHLLLHKRRLYLAGGNVVSPAVYDLETGRCLNELVNEWWSRPERSAEQFPSQPVTSMFKRSPRGRELFLVDGQVQVLDQLLYSSPRYGESRYFGGHFLQVEGGGQVFRATTNRVVRLAAEKTADGKPVGIWQQDLFQDPLAMAVCKNALVVAGQLGGTANESETYALAALSLANGQPLWTHPLPARPVSWGLAVDRHGGVTVTMQGGRVVRFAARRG